MKHETNGDTSGNRTLGIDVSTQSISAVVVDPAASPAQVVAELSITYREDPRLNRFGIDHDSLLVPPRIAGEADQPPLMFLAGLEALFGDLAATGLDLGTIAAVSVSAQQHGHVYLNAAGTEALARLADGTAATGPDLTARFADAFAYGTAPIWQTADSQEAADEIRAAVGGTEAIVSVSGSDSPARFTGAVIRRTARRYPTAWAETTRVSLLSSFLSGVLTGTDCPIDWGNGAGMTLMDYRERKWSRELVEAVAADLPGGADALGRALPELASPVAPAGRIAAYFVARYGFSPECVVNAGSGDNPQSKVMIDGDLLSLGSSFVYMVDTGEPVVDLQGYANSMYDGLGRPFVFACRTNGAMVWDRMRTAAGADYARADAALAAATPGERVEIWQPYAESYPVAPPVPNAAAAGAS
ncbi:MAG: FGGY family carbohydrate kinase [Spirochaeta sp.]|nr:FGGY family carbohydrate kinase [Spirochaeta sp.]